MSNLILHRRIRPVIGGLTLSLVLLAGFAPSLRAQPPPAEAEIQDNDRSPFHVALLAYKAGHFQEALDALNGDTTQDERTIILKAQILTELQRYDEGQKLLTSLLTQTGPLEVQLALADLLLRKRDFTTAGKYYLLALQAKPGNPDLLLKLVYTHIGSADLVGASKIASQLKPLDQSNPAYYFAKAALAQSTDKTQEASENIETARTMYGITATNRYLTTYYEVLSNPGKNSLITPAASTNAAPTAPKQ